MIEKWHVPPHKDKALFTPGPLTTSLTVKQAMLRDLGSRDREFIHIVRDIRSCLISLGGVSERDYTAILMQGSGTFGIEATISSTIPAHGKLLILVNGAYGQRMQKIASILHIDTVPLVCSEDQIPDLVELDKILQTDPEITHVAVVHCETTTGLINPIDTIGEIVQRHNRIYIVDAMSSFAAYPIPLQNMGIDYLVSSANKCIEGVPGFSFVLARKKALQATEGYARSLSLDLLAQYWGLERDGQFRFTPPTHSLLAFRQALLELEEEGGIPAREARYFRNYQATISGMEEIGFEPYLPVALRGHIITSFYYPNHPNFEFKRFYELLNEKGQVIYPGKLSHADCFRIGHIGHLSSSDVETLVSAIRAVLVEMKLPIPLPARSH